MVIVVGSMWFGKNLGQDCGVKMAESEWRTLEVWIEDGSVRLVV